MSKHSQPVQIASNPHFIFAFVNLCEIENNKNSSLLINFELEKKILFILLADELSKKKILLKYKNLIINNMKKNSMQIN